MTTNYKELYENCITTLKMISSAKVFNDGRDRMIMESYKKLADSQVRLSEHIVETNKMPKRDLDNTDESDDIDPDHNWESATRYHGEG